MSDPFRFAGVGWPNGAADYARLLALPTRQILLLNSEHWHHDMLVRSGKRPLWRAVARDGHKPAQVKWSVSRYVDEILRHTDEVTESIGSFVGWNEQDLNSERGDDADDFAELDFRYQLLGSFQYQVIEQLRTKLASAELHYGAWTPTKDHQAGVYAQYWERAANACDVIDFHAYDSLDLIVAEYKLYRALFPGKRLALTEWHCKGDLAEEARVLVWLAQQMGQDPLFEAAYFFIWRWDQAPDWWSPAYDLEHNPDRYALFLDPPVVAPQEPEPVDLRAYARDAAARATLSPDIFERQIDQESGFNPQAYNAGSGASGIAQIIPRWHPGVDVWDPQASLDYAANLMADHLTHWIGKGYGLQHAYALALSSYNAGRQATIDGIAGRKPGWPFRETVGYVRNILQIPDAQARDLLVGLAPTPGDPPVMSDVTPILQRVIELGRAEIGKRYAGPVIGEPDAYRWGDPGWDCSSFVSAMYERATNGAIKLVGYTDAAYNQCEWVPSPQPGDIVFYFYEDEQEATIPHMGIWLSSTEVLDARFRLGVGIHPHVTPVGPDAQGRFRRTMRPKGLASVVVAPPPPPPTDPLAARVAELEAEVVRLNEVLAGERTKLGVASVDYVQQLRALADAYEQLRPSV